MPSRFSSWPWAPFSVLKISTARDGVMVRALTAEMIVETAIVTANWRKNWPVIPPRKQQGTNTEQSASVMAMIGPVISSMALIVAVRASSPLAIIRSMFSSTTMASSTTMPMARTRPNSVRIVQGKAQRRHDGERTDQRDGDVDHRQDHGLPVLQEDEHDEADQDHRVAQRLEDLPDRLADVRRRVVGDVVIHARPESGS